MASYSLTHQQLEELWILAGGPPQYADTAAAIAEAESGGCQYALAGPKDIRPVKACTWHIATGENSAGFWQINLRAHPDYSAPEIFGKLENAAAAVAISRMGRDFSPWTTFTNGDYLAHLQSAGTPAPQPGATFPAPVGAVGASGHRGYADLRNSLARHLPTQLRASRRSTTATLRLLGRRHRIGG